MVIVRLTPRFSQGSVTERRLQALDRRHYDKHKQTGVSKPNSGD